MRRLGQATTWVHADAVRLANDRMGGRFLGDSPVFGADLRFFRTRRVRSCPPAPDAARTKANRAEGNIPHGTAALGPPPPETR